MALMGQLQVLRALLLHMLVAGVVVALVLKGLVVLAGEGMEAEHQER
jgi:hypothetical protein